MKTTPEPLTKVLFRKFQGELLALFPALAGTNDASTCSCYAHVGQHSSADAVGVIRRSKPAKPHEYADLHAELTRIGYRIKIGHKNTSADYAERLSQVSR